MMDESSKQLFVIKTAKEVIWGYDDQLSSMARWVIAIDTMFFQFKNGPAWSAIEEPISKYLVFKVLSSFFLTAC